MSEFNIMCKNDIYDLELHECTYLKDGTEIRKVPGGWIYGLYDNKNEQYYDAVFVPS